MTHVALLLVQVIFGINHVWCKDAMIHIDPFVLAGMRVIFGSAIFLAVVFSGKREKITKRDYGRIAIYALFGVVINQLCYLAGLNATTSTNTSILIVTIPVFTAMLAMLTRREKSVGMKWIGIAVAAAGVFVLPRHAPEGATTSWALGDTLVLINCLSYAVYLVISKDLLSKYSPLTVIAWVYTFGMVGVLPVSTFGLPKTDWAGVTNMEWAAVAYVLVFTTVVSYFLNLWALRRASSSVVAVYIYLQPVIATFLAVLFKGELLTAQTGVAAGLIFLGVYLTTIRKRVPKAEPSTA